MKNDPVVITQWGLKCDNPECDWRDDTITFKDYKKWLNAPCPKCGQNVLTKKDYKLAKLLLTSVTFHNKMSRILGIKRDPENEAKIIVGLHEEMTFKIEER